MPKENLLIDPYARPVRPTMRKRSDHALQILSFPCPDEAGDSAHGLAFALHRSPVTVRGSRFAVRGFAFAACGLGFGVRHSGFASRGSPFEALHRPKASNCVKSSIDQK